MEQRGNQPFCRLKSLQVGLHFEAHCSVNVFLPVMSEDFAIAHSYFVSHYNLHFKANPDFLICLPGGTKSTRIPTCVCLNLNLSWLGPS